MVGDYTPAGGRACGPLIYQRGTGKKEEAAAFGKSARIINKTAYEITRRPPLSSERHPSISYGE